jgi:hypothetical protein
MMELSRLLDVATQPRSAPIRILDALEDMADRLGLPNPFDFLNDDEPPLRPRRRRRGRGREAPGQLHLFDDPAEARTEDA